MDNLIQVKQLPIIEEHLRTLKEQVDGRVESALSLVCTEETLQSVKATRAELNKEFAELEERRKAVKSAVLDPYTRFEAVYKECVSDAFKRADAELGQKVRDVEGDMKRRCEDGLREYFAELCACHHIDFVPYERAGVSVSLADAKAKTQPPKKLRDQLSQFVVGVDADVIFISTLNNAEEILVEYKRTLDATASIAAVTERHRRIEAEKAARAELEEVKARETEAVKKVEAFAPPVVHEPPKVQEPAKKYRVSFTVVDTMERLQNLKQFLVSNGYKYE